jgi:hypothetical protein
LRIEIVLDGKRIHRSSFRVCRMQSPDAPLLKEEPEVAFSFRSGRVFRGEHSTNPNEMIEANIWQAGAEPEGLLVGISFSTKSRILLNTVYFANAERATESQLDRSLLIRTYPVRGSH